jgi:hypothetical protein
MKKLDIDPLQAAITTTAFARDLMATLQFPPVTAAVSVLLLILETIQVRRPLKRSFLWGTFLAAFTPIEHSNKQVWL